MNETFDIFEDTDNNTPQNTVRAKRPSLDRTASLRDSVFHAQDRPALVADQLVNVLAGPKQRKAFQTAEHFHHYSVWLYLEQLYIESILDSERFRQTLSTFPPISPEAAWQLHNIHIQSLQGHTTFDQNKQTKMRDTR